MKRFTFLLTMLFALVFGQSAFAQVGVKMSDNNVQYEYYLKRFNGDYVCGTVGTSTSTLTYSGEKVKFIFKKASNGVGTYALYATNIIKNSEGNFVLAPITVRPGSNDPVCYINSDVSDTPAEYDLVVTKCTAGSMSDKYAMMIKLRRASGGALYSNDNSWGNNPIVYQNSNYWGTFYLWVAEAATPAPMVFPTTGSLATYSTPIAATVPSGVTAYYAESNTVTDDVITLKAIAEGGTIPAGQGVIIEKSSDNSATVIETIESTATSDITSALIPTTLAKSNAPTYTSATAETSATGSIVVTKADGTNYYGLGSYTDSESSSTVQAFLPFSEESTITMPPFKAYLTTSSTIGAIKLKFPDGSTTSINGVNVGEKIGTGAIYDLSGRRVAAPIKGSLYIQNGKKFIAE